MIAEGGIAGSGHETIQPEISNRPDRGGRDRLPQHLPSRPRTYNRVDFGVFGDAVESYIQTRNESSAQSPLGVLIRAVVRKRSRSASGSIERICHAITRPAVSTRLLPRKSSYRRCGCAGKSAIKLRLLGIRQLKLLFVFSKCCPEICHRSNSLSLSVIPGFRKEAGPGACAKPLYTERKRFNVYSNICQKLKPIGRTLATTR